MIDIDQCYACSDITRCIWDYLGGTSPEDASAEYFTYGTTNSSFHGKPRHLSELPPCLEEKSEINRSLWDRKVLLAHLDIEYVNFDFPAEPYQNPERIFHLQLPVEKELTDLFESYGIRPLHLLSGRGHHYTWSILPQSSAWHQLVKLGRVSSSLEALYAKMESPNGDKVSRELGLAYSGLGLVMEYVAHLIKKKTARQCEIPLELTALEVGFGKIGREMISIDISEYGDPLSSRCIRVPFTVYLKTFQQGISLKSEATIRTPPFFVVPLNHLTSLEAWPLLDDTNAVKQMAASADCRIPDGTPGMEKLIADYKISSLADFHNWFYSMEPSPSPDWPAKFNAELLQQLPTCVRFMLENPNDFLLRPACMERVVRVLLALGWHPRHIAGLIASRFKNDYSWGNVWKGYDPETRADFYTRIFAGLFATGVDDLLDFNCVSAKEEGTCFIANCQNNLADFRKSLLRRRDYGRMAYRPFNRLFLQK